MTVSGLEIEPNDAWLAGEGGARDAVTVPGVGHASAAARGEALDALLLHLRRSHGLRFDLYKERCLRRRLDARLRKAGVKSYAEYLRILRSDEREAGRLVDALTVQVTRFFRNVESFGALEARVFPTLHAGSRGRPVRIWSAGAATGEEAYTLAILWDRVVGPHAKAPPAVVIGSDLDPLSLARARAGVYRGASLVEVAPADRERYFLSEGESFRVNPRLRAAVRFRRADLAAPLRMRFQDLIVCRNVLIYFDRLLQDSLCEAFFRALRPGGFLMLGRAEVLSGPARRLFQTVDARERLFRRPPGEDR